MNFYQDREIQMIFDISGGDIANEILPYLDFEVIAENPKPFWGYSDLTTIMNAIYAKPVSDLCCIRSGIFCVRMEKLRLQISPVRYLTERIIYFPLNISLYKGKGLRELLLAEIYDVC